MVPVQLESLAVRPGRVPLLPNLGEAVRRQHDVEGVLPDRGRLGKEVAVRGLLQQQAAPQPVSQPMPDPNIDDEIPF